MVGQIVGSYLVLEKIGRGGMGTVYRARHRHMERPAAIKVLSPDLSASLGAVKRFMDEARAASRVRHPGVVHIFDCATLSTGEPFIAMELLEGETLGAYLRRGGAVRSPAVAARIGGEIAAALAAAHAKRIVHRDLKPENVFLARDRDTGELAVKVLDFGVAKLVHERHGSMEGTRPGSLLGTPRYMSPEQCRGLLDIDARSDLYSLGCLLFEMVAGRPPFVVKPTGDLIVAHVTEPPPTLASLGREVPADLEALVGRMLGKRPDDRPGSAKDVLAALDALARADARPLAEVVYEERRPPAIAEVDTTEAAEAAPAAAPGEPGPTVPYPLPPPGGTQSEPRRREAATVGETPALPGAARRRWSIVAAAPAAVAAVLIAIAVGRRTTPPPAAPVAAPPRAAEKKHEVARPPPAERRIVVRVESSPAAAEVWVGADDRPRCVAPCNLSLSPGSQPLDVVVRRKGYHDRRRTIVPDRDQALDVALHKIDKSQPPLHAPAPAAPPPRAATPAPARDPRHFKVVGD